MTTFFAVVSGCTSQDYEYSETIPSSFLDVDYFQKVYEEDQSNQQVQSLETYMLWVERFYFGWMLYDTGWIETSEAVLGKIANPEDKRLVEEKLDLVGKTVVAEWAKHNDYGTISTLTLSTLGESLREASSRDETLRFLNLVYTDLMLLKSGDLMQGEIKIERYFPDVGADDGWSNFF